MASRGARRLPFVARPGRANPPHPFLATGGAGSLQARSVHFIAPTQKKPGGPAPPPKKPKKAASKKPPNQIPTERPNKPVPEKMNRVGRVSHEFPTESTRGDKLRTPFAGGGMVTFRFSNKTYSANERAALRLLNYWKKQVKTWQVVKPWYAKGNIRNTSANGGVFKDRKKRQGFAGKGKVVGYSQGFGPNQINQGSLNFAIRQTQASVKSAISGQKGHYKENLGLIYKPAGFTTRDSKMSFELNLFFDASGLQAFKRQAKLK